MPTEHEAALKTAQDWLKEAAIVYCDYDIADLAALILSQRREAEIEALKWTTGLHPQTRALQVEVEIAHLEREARDDAS